MQIEVTPEQLDDLVHILRRSFYGSRIDLSENADPRRQVAITARTERLRILLAQVMDLHSAAIAASTKKEPACK